MAAAWGKQGGLGTSPCLPSNFHVLGRGRQQDSLSSSLLYHLTHFKVI